MPTFTNPVARDQAWAKWYAKHGGRPPIFPASRERWGSVPTPAERLESWRRKVVGMPIERLVEPVCKKYPSVFISKEKSHEQERH